VSALLLGAHYFRGGSTLLAALAALAPLILVFRRPIARRVLSILLLAGALEWVRTLLVDVSMRRAIGAPWGRLAVILGAAAVFTAWSALLIRRPPGRPKEP
jgi:hypothetical protein